MIPYNLLQDTLNDSFEEVLDFIGLSDIRITFANQNTLEPTKTYMVIDILDISQEGFTNEASFIAEEDILETMTHYCLKAQFSFIGKEAGTAGFTFRHHIVNNRACFEKLMKANLGLLKRGKLRSNPQKRETEWVDSFNMDLDLSFAIFTKQSFDWIEYITINGEVIRIWNAQ